MPENTADIRGTKGSSFTISIDAATIVRAKLIVPNQPDVELTVGASNREVSMPDSGLPSGDSTVSLALIWTPGDPDAIIDVGTVISGTVSAADPKHTIDAGDTPGFVELFGK